MKSVVLKTYGKQKRTLSAWVSPQTHKRAFDSSSVSTDDSVFEPAKPKRESVASRKVARPAKKKAMLYLREKSFEDENEENIAIPSPPHPRNANSRKTRGKKTSVCSGRAVRPARRKTLSCETDNSSDENISRPSPPRAWPAQQSKTTRKNQLMSEPGILMRWDDQQVSVTSDSEIDSILSRKCHKISVHTKRQSNFPPPSVGRFVTRRRRAVATKTTIAAQTSSFATNPLREVSLNELSDHSFKVGSRKHIFCSTPSTASFTKRSVLKHFPISDQSSAPLSMSISCIGVLSPYQQDVNSLGQIVTSPHMGLPSVEKLKSGLGKKPPDLHQCEDPSGDLFMVPKSTNIGINCSEDVKSHSGEFPQLNLLSTDSESSSYFVSAAGGLEWLIEALKERCLTKPCTVQLERLNILPVTQLWSQTTYSSCLGDEHSVNSQQIKEHPVSLSSCQTVNLLQSTEASFNICSSVTSNKNGDHLLTGNSFDSHKETTSVTDSRSSADHRSPSVNYEQSAKPLSVSGFMEQSVPVLYDESNHHTNINNLKTNKSVFRLAMLKEKCIYNKVTVDVRRQTFSELKDLLKFKDASLNSPTVVSDPATDVQTRCAQQSDSDTNHCNEDTFSMKISMKKRRSTSSDNKISSDKENVKSSCDILPKRKKMSLAVKEMKRRSTSTDRPGTARKVCVSGLSVSRWKNKGSSKHGFKSRTAQSDGIKAGDCSISELISSQHRQPRELGATLNFSTPLKTNPFNLSSLMADFTPNTYSWSRLKAALSIHRKGMVLLTPRALTVSGSPERASLADISQDLFATPLRTPLPKYLQSQLLRNDSLVVCDDADLSDAEKVYAECGQQHPLPWEECILPHRMKRCVKIGEGTFGEVFSTTNALGDTVALKIIPVEGSEKVNGEDQKTYGEILHEIIISKELSSLKEKQANQTHGFIGLNDLHCIQGSYPPDFLNAWDKFDQEKCSENDRPDFFTKEQLFIILEFEFGGNDLENSNGRLASLAVAKSILHQVTAAMAVAEEELHFEHRDLHWGNVLVKTTKQKTYSFLLNGTSHSLETRGVLVRIIDYSLSRLEIDDLTVSCDISKDEELFMGQGDYQFEIYRLMRKENRNNWSDYHPYSNVLWLHYLCSKLLSMKYRGTGGKGAKNMRKELTCFYDNVLKYSSAMEVLQNCPMFQ